MTMTYESACELLEGTSIKPLAPKIMLLRIENDVIGVRLYDTIIMTVNQLNEYRYYAGHYQTKTTMDCINRYGPVRVTKKKNQWYVNDMPFFDGILVNPALPTIDDFPKEQKINSLLDQYVSGYSEYVLKNGIFVGLNDWSIVSLDKSLRLGYHDCPICFNAPSGRVIPSDHIENHMKMREFVPSLLYKALSYQVKDPALMWAFCANEVKNKRTKYVEQILSKFLTHKLSVP